MGKKIIMSLRSGFLSALNSRKGVMIYWFSLFILILVFIFPLRGSLSAAFGRSMIIDKLSEGIDIEIFTDLGAAMGSIVSFFTAGLIFTYLAGFLLNSFMTAGLFGSVRKDIGKFSSQEFFRSGAKNFWSFFVILLIITLIISILSAFIIGIPVIIISLSESISEKTGFSIVIGSIALYLLLIPVLLLTADYARAWRSANENDSCFRSIGKGFSLTFSKFWSSYFMMLILIIIQVVLGILILIFIPVWKPATAGGVLLLLVVSQLTFYLRLLLKTWRYACVTTMMGENPASLTDTNDLNK